MTGRRMLAYLGGAGAVFALGVVGPAGLLSIGLELGGLVGLLYTLYRLLRPLAVEMDHYRVRYVYPATAAPLDAARVGAHLALLARYGERVSLYWRQADTLALYLSVPRAVARPLQRLLPEVWPGAVLEPVATVPPVPEPLTGVQIPRGSHLGQGGPEDPLDFAAALPPVVGWVHWQRDGGVIILGLSNGRPDPAAPPPRRGWRLPLRGRGAGWVAVHWPWVAAWSGPPAVRWPHTDAPRTQALDPQRTLVLPPPATYRPPAHPLEIGRSVGDQVLIGLDRAAPATWGHLLWLTPPTPARQARLLRLVEQALAADWGVVLVDNQGDLAAAFYAQADPPLRARIQRLDLLSPTPALRPSLWAPPATTAAAALAAAVVRGAEQSLPAFLRYLGALGLTPAGLGAAAPLVPAWIGASLVAHYRARLTGAPPPPLPEIPALVAAWETPDRLSELVQTEQAAWTTPTGALTRALDAAGPVGAAARGAALALLGPGRRVLTAVSAADRRLYTVTLHSRLAAVLRRAPALARLWADPQEAAALLNARPAPVVVLDGASAAASETGRQTAGWYGLYWLQVLEAVSRDRTVVASVPPLLVLWVGLAPVWGLVPPAALGLQAATLRAGGIHLVGVDTTLDALALPTQSALRRAWETWVLGPPPLAAPAWDALLGALGAPAGFSCRALPPDTAVVRLPDPAAGLCTVQIDPHMAQSGAPGAPPALATAPGRQEEVHVSRRP